MFEPLKFLNLAEELVRGDIDEAKIRTSIGRSYYASFLLAREAAGLSDLKAPEVHRKVISFLYSKDPPVANKLHILRRQRNNADYDLDRTFGLEESEESLKMAKNIVERLRRSG